MLVALTLPTLALAQGDAPSAESIAIDTVWVMLATFLVFFMQAGFFTLEVGFSRAKNAGHIAWKILVNMAISGMAFWAVGFAIAFGSGSGFAGSSGWFLNVSPDNTNTVFSSLAFSNVPISAKFLFEFAFAAVSLAIVYGALLERTKMVVYFVFGIVFSAFVYPVVGHWIWGGGWLSQLGMQDFAGSTVVHLLGATSALVGAVALGPRIGKYGRDGKPKPIPGHSMPLALLGVIILWLGWFGFNPGSTLNAMDLSFADIALVTNMAAVAGVLGAMITAWLVLGKPDIGMTANGAIAALVAITAGSGYVQPWAAVIIGGVAGTVMVLMVLLIDRIRIDDPIGALSCHGISGIWGTLATGLFAAPSMVDRLKVGTPGLFYGGGFHQLGVQALGVAAVFAFVLVCSGIVFYGLKYTVGIRLTPEQELSGSDFAEHGMWGYPEHFVGPDDGSDGTALADRLREVTHPEHSGPAPTPAQA
ncbi:MAG: ammonium transporter [Actinobacteria bacterium]|nr:ammonium transporter [Actinomycetota bacterium]MCL5883031.1 ammonium transporter [Actinomycetota bacterium]